MASTKRDYYIAWLRDAHAMEKQALTILDAQESRMADYPELSQRLAQHHIETEHQLAQIQSILDRLDEDGSVFKDLTARAVAATQLLGGMMSSDEPVKGVMMSYVFEQMEIASYTCLIAAARECGDMDAVPVLTAILDQELEMASWLKENLDTVTLKFLNQQEANTETESSIGARGL